ncbi:MAG TPA: hypothetical protein VKG25_11680 [Bryobacteraceae bacterium]|nr:hypothetical protein [Bryobacteraceae bacterium]
MQYVLTGFTHDMGFRVFAFEGVGEDRVRTEYKVRADLGLIRRYGIRVQELPLLCRGVLERRIEGEDQRNLTYTETDMRLNADACAIRAAAAAQKRKPAHRPVTENVGAAWRGPQT